MYCITFKKMFRAICATVTFFNDGPNTDHIKEGKTSNMHKHLIHSI